VTDTEMRRTFNCGIGMVVAIDPADQDRCLDVLRAAGEDARVIGRVEGGHGPAIVAYEEATADG
jgi:phosphoribosylformylglycinamidine cyclo-ligase